MPCRPLPPQFWPLLPVLERLSAQQSAFTEKKAQILEAKAPYCRTKLSLLSPDASYSAAKTYYKCHVQKHTNCSSYVSESNSAYCPQCGSIVGHALTTVMLVLPGMGISIITLFSKVGIRNTELLDEKVINTGMDETKEGAGDSNRGEGSGDPNRRGDGSTRKNRENPQFESSPNSGGGGLNSGHHPLIGVAGTIPQLGSSPQFRLN
ncbi:hypothetical protein CRG98_005000 [Punica granatum]|uniref:Uncharacterized protein n=1 Tax=Punica granatum TaxID=22663 RepID=A0A2I0L211_PUNGR|nr:hypothetical protein CRG98_005000 [Punica granatum]